MITGELKSKVDRLWDAFWSGGISNPLEVIEQITYLLFIKRLDELHAAQEAKANRLKKPIENPIFSKKQQDLRWSRFKNEAAGEMYKVVSEKVFPFIKELKSAREDSTYQHHMKDARFTIPNAGLLAKVVDMIDKIPMEDRDTKGDLYEYMLSKIATAGQNGQFRTPRHIIRLMVELVKPTPRDIVCDPACGTAGFLVAVGEYLREHHKEIFTDDKLRHHFHEKLFNGFDFDSTMLRIGSMNMLLHGVENPNIRYKDSLAEEHAGDEERYTLVLANPPFAGSLDYENTAKDLQRVVKTKKTELLFIALFLRLLKAGGRAAVIVPDGVLFGSSNAHKTLRKILVEEQKLDAVISLPGGVFKPYAGVSTAILVFTKTNSGGTDYVWFYDVDADGWSLDDKRTALLPDEKLGPVPSVALTADEHPKNNLPDIVARWTKRDNVERKNARTAQSFCVPKADIAAQAYDLSLNRYKEVVHEEIDHRPPLEILTNGYKTWFWDDLNYPPREVQGFYKRDELELLIQRRSKRKDVSKEGINKEIVERYYQEESIRAVTEHFANRQRKALVVMATGAGKTRTVIALCELLQRCNWVKRVLFLADRVALVRQACNAFKKHLPDSNPVNLVTEKFTDSRVYVSTYPTMMGQINEIEDGRRRLGVGHFDLVIIDEAHRSVYQKYRAIFEYFDSLLVGLTATPKDEVDRNTYSLFDLEKGVPTYSYDLDQAVDDRYLVPYVPVEVPLKFLRGGIKYDDLSEEEKDEWDAIEWDEDKADVPESVDAAALNKWLFNADTVDKVLETLMTRGQKIAGGDVLGKTIIFAKNKNHAGFVQDRFDTNYPHYKGAFARTIVSGEPYAQTLLDEFSTPDKLPQIALSVDMLDTGIDIPEIVNLVFFKILRSKTKFFQMIGRGTRLRPDLFGPGEDKKFFYIFDFCENLEFFKQEAKGVEGSTQVSLATKIFRGRVELLEKFRHIASVDDSIRELDVELSETLRQQIETMNVDNFLVRPHRRVVEKFREPAVWEELSPDEFEELEFILAGLPTELDPEDETAKRFDLIMLKLQLATLNNSSSFIKLRDQIKEIASRLEEKRTIPMVNDQLDLIFDLQQDEYWADITLPMLEEVRKRLRDLVKFIDKKQRKLIYTDFEDEMGDIIVGDYVAPASAVNIEQYKKKVMSFLREHENHIALQKLKRNIPITASDLSELERILFQADGVGTREDFEKAYGKQEHLGLFIRKLIGLDRQAAKRAFRDYLDSKTLTANQIRFIDLIIDYLTQNGVMDPSLLYEAPFTDYCSKGLDGMFVDTDASGIVSILNSIRKAAVA